MHAGFCRTFAYTGTYYGIGEKSCNSWSDSDGSQAARSGNLCTYAVDEKSRNKALHAGHRCVRYGETRREAIT